MELSKQEMELFHPFLVIKSKSLFNKSIPIRSIDFKSDFKNRKLNQPDKPDRAVGISIYFKMKETNLSLRYTAMASVAILHFHEDAQSRVLRWGTAQHVNCLYMRWSYPCLSSIKFFTAHTVLPLESVASVLACIMMVLLIFGSDATRGSGVV